jgi:hypothetical protein
MNTTRRRLSVLVTDSVTVTQSVTVIAPRPLAGKGQRDRAATWPSAVMSSISLRQRIGTREENPCHPNTIITTPPLIPLTLPVQDR